MTKARINISKIQMKTENIKIKATINYLC